MGWGGVGWGGGWGGLGWGVKVVTSLFQGPWKANTQVNSERKLTQFFSLQVEAMRVVLSHTLRMEFTVQLFNRRSMYCVDMFPKIMLQTDTNFLHVVTCMQKFCTWNAQHVLCCETRCPLVVWDVKRNLPIVGLQNGRMREIGIGCNECLRRSDALDSCPVRCTLNRKTVLTWIVLSVLKMSVMSVFCHGLFFNKNVIWWPTIPIVFIISIVGCVPIWPIICPIWVIITPTLFGMGSFLTFCHYRRWARCRLLGNVGLLLLVLLRWFSSFALVVTFSFSFPSRHSFERTPVLPPKGVQRRKKMH